MVSGYARWIGAGALASALIWAAMPALACPTGQGKQHMHQGGMAMMHQGGGMHGMHGQHGTGGGACNHGQGGGRTCPFRGGGAAATEVPPADPGDAAVAETGSAQASHAH